METIDDELNIVAHIYDEYNYKWLIKKIDKLKKIANKVGVEMPLIEISEPFAKKVKGIGGKEETILYYTIQYYPFQPCYDNAEFIARIEHHQNNDEYHNLIYSYADIEFEQYYKRPPLCEHCNTIRKRNDTYLVAKEGEIYQVGSKCMTYFTGGGSTDYYVRLAEFATELNRLNELDEQLYSKSKFVQAFPIKELLAEFLYLSNTYGFISKSVARADIRLQATVDKYLYIVNYDSIKNHADKLEAKEEFEEMEKSVKLLIKEGIIDNMIEHILNKPITNNYMQNVANILNLEYVEAPNIYQVKSLGIIASIPNIYLKDMRENNTTENEYCEKNAYIGYVGEKVVISGASVIDIEKRETMYGIRHAYTCIYDGFVLKISKSNGPLSDDIGNKLEINDIISFKGKIARNEVDKALNCKVSSINYVKDINKL